MSRNKRHSRRRAFSIQVLQQKNWLRRYLRALKSGIAAASIGAATIGSVGLVSQSAFGATWIGNTSANWADAANWSSLPISGDSLTFNAQGTSGLNLVDNLTGGPGFSITGITFTNLATGSAYVINPLSGGNGFALSNGITNNSTSTQTINDNITLSGPNVFTGTAGGGNITLGGVLAGGGATVTTAGGGALTLSGANTYTGNTTVAAGTQLNINNAGTTAANSAIGTGNLIINGGTIDNT